MSTQAEDTIQLIYIFNRRYSTLSTYYVPKSWCNSSENGVDYDVSIELSKERVEND